MKINRIEYLIKKEPFASSPEFKQSLDEIYTAISKVVWPPGSPTFTINPVKHGSGVKPIKEACMTSLVGAGWELEKKLSIAVNERPGPIDAIKRIGNKFISVEWETGNISSSHRALNKMGIGLLDGTLLGGILILPSAAIYPYLTDRIGNFPELVPYFPLWRSLQVENGVLAIIEIEHDNVDTSVPFIKKGTDGRALK